MTSGGPVPSSAKTRPTVGRVLGWTFGGALLVIFLAALAAHTPPARRLALSYVQRLLAEAYVLDVSADSLRYNLFDLSLSVRNLRIGRHDGTLPPLAEVTEADVDLSLWALLRGRYVVDAAHASGVHLQYVVAADGTDNLPRSSAPSDDTGTVDYLVRHLTITSFRIQYDNRATDVRAELPVSSLTMTGSDLTGRHAIQVDGRDGTFRAGTRGGALDQFSAAFDLGRDDLRIDRLTATGVGSELHADGRLVGFSSPEIDLRMQATANIAAVAAAAGIAASVAGTADVDGHIVGPSAALMLRTQVRARDLRYQTLTDLSLNVAAGFDVAARTATVTALRLEAPWAVVTASGDVGLGETADSRVRLAIEALDGGTFLAAAAAPYSAATRLDARLDASWRGTNYRMATGNAVVFLTPRPTRRPGELPVGGRLTVAAQEGSATVRLDSLRTRGLEADGRIALSRTDRLGGQLRVRARELSEVVRTAEAALRRPPGSLVPVMVRGSAAADAVFGGTLDSPTAAVSVEAPRLVVGSASGLDLRARVAYAASTVRIETADLAWHAATAHASGRVGLEGVRPLELALQVDALRLPDVLAAAQQPLPLDGVLTLNARVGGTTSRPTATATLSASELVAYGEPLGTMRADGRLEGRTAEVTRLVLEKPQGDRTARLDASGRYDLDSGSYDVSVRSDEMVLQRIVLPDGRAVSATVTVDGAGAGTVDDPHGTLHLAAANVTVGSDAFGNLGVDVDLADQRATIDARSDRFRTRASGVVAVHAPYATTLSARIDGLELDTLPVAFERPVTGQLSGSLEGRVDLADPTTARGTATIDDFAGQWNDRPFGLDGPATFAYADQRLQIDRLRLAAQDSTVSVQGTLPVAAQAGQGEIVVEARLDLATLVGYVPDAGLRGDGTIALTGRLRGTLAAIDPQLMLSIDNGRLASDTLAPGLSDLSVRASVENGEAVLQYLRGNWGTAKLDASARIPLAVLPALPVDIPRQAGAAALRASVTGLDVATIPGAPAELAGRITVQADAEGTSVTDLRAVTGRVTAPELDLSFRTLSLRQEEPVTISLAEGVATIERFRLTGSAGTLSASGRVGVLGERRLDVRADGNMELAVLSIFTDAVRTSGALTLALSAGGTLDSPNLDGTIDLADATAVVDAPRITAENVAAHVALAGRQITLTSLSGQLNGGTLEASGALALADGGVADVDLQVTTTDFAFDAPLELRSLSDSTLRLDARGDEFVVEGTVTIKDAGLTGDINFDTGLLAAVTARRQLDLTESRNPLLERVRFNVNVNTTEPILVDNNLARAEVTADLRVVGTPYDTGLAGRLTLVEGGQLTLNERRYIIDRGIITFLDERRILPSFDLALNTTASRYDITLAVSGTPGDTETTLTASPTLPQPDIMALLVTGRTLDEMRGEEYDVAREQILSYLTGRVGSTLGRGIERATGLSEVRIEPNLIANEADPSARLTVGQDLTDELGLVYSTNLTDGTDQIWVAQYDLTRRFQTRAVRQADNSYRLDFRHDVRFGGQPEPGRVRQPRPVIGTVRVSGDPGIEESEVLRLLGATEGKTYDYFQIRRGIERLERAYRDRDYLQARIRVIRARLGQRVDLDFRITPGPPVTVTFTGLGPPSKVGARVREQWRRGVFDAQRLDDGQRVLREWLLGERYLQATIRSDVREAPGRRHVMFVIEPGLRSERIVLVFEGAQSIAPAVLEKIIDDQKLERKLLTDPFVVTELLRRYYREQAYLAATIAAPRLEFEGSVARIVLRIDEGPHFTTGTMAVTGNRLYDSPALIRELPLVSGESFLPAVAERSLDRIRDLYWQRGYNDVRSDYALVVDRNRGDIGITFQIAEGPQTVVAGVAVAGTEKISEQLVRQEMDLAPARPLDLAALGRSRKALYDVGAFSVVDITREFVAAPAEVTASDPMPTTAEQRPVTIQVAVREVQPFQIGYGASYDTERGPGGIFDIANYNSLGRARVIGFRTRYDAQVRELRGFISQPSLRDWPVRTTASLYYREERNPETTLTEGFVFDRRGVSVQQEKELRNSYVWSYGYRYEQVRTFTGPSTTGQDRLTVSPFTSTFTREGRDDVLDASRGSFTAHAFAVSPAWLGVDGAYMKYYGQYFHYIPLQGVRRKPLTNELLRPRLVFATGVRLGLARGLGGHPVPLAERFFAGGSTTLRGFEQNAVGPISATGVPTGGEALFVLNNEVRVPLVSIVDGVAFLDVGNVFERVRGFSFIDLRESAGVGLRVRTPWFLVRGDLGFALDPRAGERRSRFFFSIGQAF